MTSEACARDHLTTYSLMHTTMLLSFAREHQSAIGPRQSRSNLGGAKRQSVGALN
jgi:hypothetical protein